MFRSVGRFGVGCAVSSMLVVGGVALPASGTPAGVLPASATDRGPDHQTGNQTGNPAGHRNARTIDGFRLCFLPAGLGSLVTDFDYEWEDVAFVDRTWERQVADGYRVDLSIAVGRGAVLSSASAMYAYMAEYLEQDPATWDVRPIRVHGRPGYFGAGRVFFLARPGVMISVLFDAERFAPGTGLRIAGGIRSATSRSEVPLAG
jgi:hypothetical protein